MVKSEAEFNERMKNARALKVLKFFQQYPDFRDKWNECNIEWNGMYPGEPYLTKEDIDLYNSYDSYPVYL